VPSPSKYVKCVKEKEIEEIPLSESFHYLGQPARHRSLSYNFDSGLLNPNKPTNTSVDVVKRGRSRTMNFTSGLEQE